MCTRFFIDRSDDDELGSYVDAAVNSALARRMHAILGKKPACCGEIHPTDMAAVIAPGRDGKQAVFPMIWGYHIGGLTRPVINARIESAMTKKSFSEDWRRHRCMIPASCYFEWEHIRQADGKIRTGQKYAIRPGGESITFLAGLYRIEEAHGIRYPVFTVLTREPSETLLTIHDRMPVILPREAVDDWLRPDADPEEITKASLTKMDVEKTLL